MQWLGDYLIPFLLLIIVFFGMLKKANIFDCFVEGVKGGLSSTLDIIPSVFALVLCVGMLKSSGAIELISSLLFPITKLIGMPKEITSLALIRPISGSGATATLNSILSKYSPDGVIGKIASVMAGSTETTFYAIAVYFGAVGIKNTRYTVFAALSADLCSMVMSCVIVSLFG